MSYHRARPRMLMKVRALGDTYSDAITGKFSTPAYQQQQAALGAALAASIASGNAGTAAQLSTPAGQRELATVTTQQQNANVTLTGAQSGLLAAQAVTQGSVASENYATAAEVIPQQAAVLQQQATSQAADTYQQVQGGGIVAQTYTALPYILGGVVVLGLVGWILFYNNKKLFHRKGH